MMTGTWITYTAKEFPDKNRPNFFPLLKKRRKNVISARLIPTAKIESHNAKTADCQLPSPIHALPEPITAAGNNVTDASMAKTKPICPNEPGTDRSHSRL